MKTNQNVAKIESATITNQTYRFGETIFKSQAFEDENVRTK